MCLKGIAEPQSENSGRDLVDLLWFPTGGGKTFTAIKAVSALYDAGLPICGEFVGARAGDDAYVYHGPPKIVAGRYRLRFTAVDGRKHTPPGRWSAPLPLPADEPTGRM